MIHENPQQAFETAIEAGRLSADEHSTIYAGNYMYMFTDDNGTTQFKHRGIKWHIHNTDWSYLNFLTFIVTPIGMVQPLNKATMATMSIVHVLIVGRSSISDPENAH